MATTYYLIKFCWQQFHVAHPFQLLKYKNNSMLVTNSHSFQFPHIRLVQSPNYLLQIIPGQYFVLSPVPILIVYTNTIQFVHYFEHLHSLAYSMTINFMVLVTLIWTLSIGS